MKSWAEFAHKNSELAMYGKRLLFQFHPYVGYAFIATLRKDGAPRLHPISLVMFNGHIYVLIPHSSPKCSDLLRDGRFAMQAFPPPDNQSGEEFYLSGNAVSIPDTILRKALIAETEIHADESEVFFELLLDRAMYSRLVNQGKPDEHPEHHKWHAVD